MPENITQKDYEHAKIHLAMLINNWTQMYLHIQQMAAKLGIDVTMEFSSPAGSMYPTCFMEREKR